MANITPILNGNLSIQSIHLKLKKDPFPSILGTHIASSLNPSQTPRGLARLLMGNAWSKRAPSHPIEIVEGPCSGEGGNDHCKHSTHYTYIQNRIDLNPYTQCLTSPSAFIHGDLWGSFRVLDKGEIELQKHVCK